MRHLGSAPTTSCQLEQVRAKKEGRGSTFDHSVERSFYPFFIKTVLISVNKEFKLPSLLAR